MKPFYPGSFYALRDWMCPNRRGSACLGPWDTKVGTCSGTLKRPGQKYFKEELLSGSTTVRLLLVKGCILVSGPIALIGHYG